MRSSLSRTITAPVLSSPGPTGTCLDKTGVSVNYDRLDLKLNHPEQYARFLDLYEHFRDSDFDSDKDFLPDAYAFKI